MKLTTVYRAEPLWAQQALTELRRAGVRAEIVDAPSPAVSQKAAFTTTVQVAVPESELSRARYVLARWAAQSEAKAKPLGRRAGAGLIVVFGPPVLAWAVTSIPEVEAPSWLFEASAAWVVLAIAIVAVVQRRSARKVE